MSVDTIADALLFFCIFFLCGLPTVKGAVEYLGSVPDLNVGISIEDVRYRLAVCVEVLASHGPFFVDHPRRDFQRVSFL